MILYTDMDPFCCSWLEELIKAGCLPKGDVLCADMTEINPESVRKYAQRHWCCGIGGWPYALKLAGWPEDRPIDTASLPCQPFSVAGKQKGFADERHLWPSFRRTVSILRPATLVGEQVPQAVQLGWLDGVFDDLEELGYACGAVVLPACSLGAPHIRQRLFWVGIAQGTRLEKRIRLTGNAGKNMVTPARERFEQTGDAGGLDNTPSPRCHPAGQGAEGETRDGSRVRGFEPGCPTCGLADTPDDNRRPGECKTQSGVGPEGIGRRGSASGGSDGRLADTERNGRRPIKQERGPERRTADGRDNPWAASVLIHCADGKWRRVPGRMVQSDGTGSQSGSEATEGAGHRDPIESAGGRVGKWEIEPALFPLADGLPNRVGVLRGAGNAIIPQVAAEFIRAFMEGAKR